jgi:prophage regulatory protein
VSPKPIAIKTPIAASIPAQNPAPPISLFDRLSDSAFVREAQLVQSPKRPDIPAPWPFSAPTYWRKVKAGTLPTPYKLSARVSAQNVGECRAIAAAWAEGKSEDEIRDLVKRLHAKRAGLATI